MNNDISTLQETIQTGAISQVARYDLYSLGKLGLRPLRVARQRTHLLASLH